MPRKNVSKLTSFADGADGVGEVEASHNDISKPERQILQVDVSPYDGGLLCGFSYRINNKLITGGTGTNKSLRFGQINGTSLSTWPIQSSGKIIDSCIGLFANCRTIASRERNSVTMHM